MFVIAGLGNPEQRFQKTRHNIGFDTLDALAAKYGIAVKEKKHRALVGSGVIDGVKVLLVKPQTYMNNSGESITDVMHFYKLDPETDLLVIYDDISLAPGNLRIRKKGSAGGHNGIKSIIACLGTQEFARIKVGVGEKPPGWALVDHVLGRMAEADRKLADEAIGEAVEAAALIVRGETDEAMNRFNSRKIVQGETVNHPNSGKIEQQEET